ncbi:NAD-dependent epimerase/dehydratase family protein [Streptomyces triticirhizae]|uniref:NAD-dependent epimerase/dehydratase family protein n=1 Tax=Streptomyces triticirhizae TaxID=2483353 RepID=A0A3M2M4W8_9ACTN|nr:NAD-dependent epimerase/dehydratase family protein [Streptomyces triticirhizae]RMI44804.1 NAD-dependent epimerase/dehydratase family protein [Streptomyces triticirhizae]
MPRILVTGASGSLGATFTRQLIDRGADVVALLKPGEGPGGLAGVEGRFETRQADVRDPAALRAAMRGIDEVYHFAGVAITLNRLRGLMEEINVRGTGHVVRAAGEAGVRRVVHASSISAIGYPPAGELADEDFDVRRSVTRNSYMDTKLGGEREALRASAETGVEVVMVNLGAVIAPYSHPRYGWAMLVEQTRRGRMRGYPPGGLAMCSIEDLTSGMLAAMAKGQPSRRYIVHSTNISYRDLIGTIAGVVGAPPPRHAVPAPAIRVAGRLGAAFGALRRDPMRSPFVVPENTTLMLLPLYYDTTRAETELGLRPTPLENSIAAVDRWLDKERKR